MANEPITVWYANPKQFSKLLRWTSCSVKGELQATSGMLIFTDGGELELVLKSIQNVNVVSRPIPWLGLAVDGGLVLAIILGGATSWLTLNNPLTFPIVIVIGLLILLSLSWVKWVDVEFLDDAGKSQHAYFADGTSFGMARGRGGVSELLKYLQKAFQQQGEEKR